MAPLLSLRLHHLRSPLSGRLGIYVRWDEGIRRFVDEEGDAAWGGSDQWSERCGGGAVS